MCNQTSVVSPPCRGTMKHLSAACWDRCVCVCVCVLFFDASKQYTCLQCPCSPFAKYISHIPTAPFNTEKCKERLALPFLPTVERRERERERYTMIPWELPGIRWSGVGFGWRLEGGGGEQCVYCLLSIGSRCRIGVAVLVNSCVNSSDLSKK